MHKFSIVNDEVLGDIDALNEELQGWEVHGVDNGIGHYEFWGAHGVHHDYQAEADEDVNVEISINYNQAEENEDTSPEDYIDWILDNVENEFKFDSYDHIPDDMPKRVYSKVPHIEATFKLKRDNVKIDTENKIITLTLNWENYE